MWVLKHEGVSECSQNQLQIAERCRCRSTPAGDPGGDEPRQDENDQGDKDCDGSEHIRTLAQADVPDEAHDERLALQASMRSRCTCVPPSDDLRVRRPRSADACFARRKR